MAASATTISDLHNDIILQTLSKMDGPTLAVASSSASLFRDLASNSGLWQNLCLSTWPSLSNPRLSSLLSVPGQYRNFFSDSFPFPCSADKEVSTSYQEQTGKCFEKDDDENTPPLPGKLISAIDLFHKGVPVFSRVVDTDTSSSWFLTLPFRVDGLDKKDPDPYPMPVIDPEELTLSWVVIDPESTRAINISSRRPVSIDRHWYTGETLVRFAIILRECAVSVVITCAEETGYVTEMNMRVENLDGMSMSGKGSLVILKAATEGNRVGVKEEFEVKEKYEEFMRKKKERLDRKVRREGMLDLVCTGFGALMFLSFVGLVAFR